jgi:hypothetical protein
MVVPFNSDQAQLVKLRQKSSKVAFGDPGQLNYLLLVGIADAIFGKGDEGLVDIKELGHEPGCDNLSRILDIKTLLSGDKLILSLCYNRRVEMGRVRSARPISALFYFACPPSLRPSDKGGEGLDRYSPLPVT